MDYFNAAHLDVGDAGFAFFTYFRIGRKRSRYTADVPPSGMPPQPETGSPPFLVLPGYKAFVELQSGSVIAILGSKVRRGWSAGARGGGRARLSSAQASGTRPKLTSPRHPTNTHS